MSFVNNIVRGGSTYAAVFGSQASLLRKDHNLFFSNGSVAVRLGNTDIANLAAWTAATSDFSSIFADPLLAEGSYTWPVGAPAYNAAIVIPGFDYDMNATLRDNPDMGCWEYAFMGLETPSNLLISRDPATGEILLSWDAVAGATSYKVWYASSPDAANWSFVNVTQPSARLSGSAGLRFYKVTALN
jgi:hypothetical protein